MAVHTQQHKALPPTTIPMMMAISSWLSSSSVGWSDRLGCTEGNGLLNGGEGVGGTVSWGHESLRITLLLGSVTNAKLPSGANEHLFRFHQFSQRSRTLQA
jgi:hypothetical protein